MLRTRVIPALLLQHESLVKTQRFSTFDYVGDPCNTVRIFNELEVDELFFLDIAASREKKGPNLQLLADIANECFMPLGYGGGIRSLDDARSVFSIGFEKVAVNTHALENPSLISEIATEYGSQAVVVSVDVKGGVLGGQTVRSHSGRHNTGRDPVAWAQEAERLGAGELFLTAIDREGTWSGFDIDLVKKVTDAVSIPVIAHGGAGSLSDIRKVVKQAGASAVALGSMVVYQKQGNGILVHFPETKELEATLA
ncbi:imidazole glycerol phosphate synthase subunit HisF [Herbaspirillum seropedicae]|uniref:imidazole glycerol-phosphate synthase n=2 Tax=Herbaspirillum seropedicae TaxID=964 RepID=D8IUE1_HERSS|nr:AglZ/HisF2 family acetamidino modification protein [Herbaspirillum seropedicae]ADJ65673.1 imidazoleglycerol-phosphate synthase protein [Herbaspirillum seropedicae SmR1]AKN67488.1 imidazole glycerol phosphate synthase [Herbaspirillum seropedicae]NQE32077.1 imidazole glycerol phosphate synthase [Herbaspirillum seropedicae]UMU23496.1 imidazole glycerol phosphate synthase subunit HisF [Herbaspirillum seropedicae]CAM32625.1 Imidazoleglycerol-phosphate synthase protein [Herbaspirillum seropedicae